MTNTLSMKARLLLIAAALILALTISSSVLDTAHARMNEYEPCQNPWVVNPEFCSP